MERIWGSVNLNKSHPYYNNQQIGKTSKHDFFFL
jgi:hypothetical protein